MASIYTMITICVVGNWELLSKFITLYTPNVSIFSQDPVSFSVLIWKCYWSLLTFCNFMFFYCCNMTMHLTNDCQIVADIKKGHLNNGWRWGHWQGWSGDAGVYGLPSFQFATSCYSVKVFENLLFLGHVHQSHSWFERLVPFLSGPWEERL